MMGGIKRILLGNPFDKSLPKERPDAIILAAGMLGKKTLFPKALLEHGGKTALEHQISWLEDRVGKIIIACHDRERKEIEKYLEKAGLLDEVEFSTEAQLLGTAGATRKAVRNSRAEWFIVCNVDDLTDIDLNSLLSFGPDTMCVANPRLNFGVMETEGIDIKRYREKPILRDVWANCGIYLLSRKSIGKMPLQGSLEHDVWPYVNMRAFKHFGMWKTFGK